MSGVIAAHGSGVAGKRARAATTGATIRQRLDGARQIGRRLTGSLRITGNEELQAELGHHDGRGWGRSELSSLATQTRADSPLARGRRVPHFSALPTAPLLIDGMPASPPLRPRSPSEIVDAAFQILRAQYGPFVTCAAIGYSPLVLLRLFVIGDPMRFLSVDPATVPGELLRSWSITMLASWLTFSLMSAVLLVCASQAYLGAEVDVGAAVRSALPRLPAVLGSALLRFALMAVATVLFVFPVLWVVALLFAVTPVVVLERAGVGASFARSRALSKGRKRHVLNTLGLVAIIYYVLVAGFSIVASAAGNFVVSTIVSSLVTVLVYPVVAITEALLYYDARIKGEGFDIELMAGALDGDVAPRPAAI